MLTELDPVSTELEIQRLLYALVRALQPALIVETGTYLGYTTGQLASAVIHNHQGHLISCDINSTYITAARERNRYYISAGVLEIREQSSLELPELRQADFIFSDSDYHLRIKELELAKSGATIVVHDTSYESWQKYDKSAAYLGEYILAHKGLLFNVGRGFGVLIKP